MAKCLGVVLSSILSCDKSQSSLVDEIPGDGTNAKGASFGESLFRQIRVVQRNLPVFAIFKYVHLKIINMSKWPTLRWHVLLLLHKLRQETTIKQQKKECNIYILHKTPQVTTASQYSCLVS